MRLALPRTTSLAALATTLTAGMIATLLPSAAAASGDDERGVERTTTTRVSAADPRGDVRGTADGKRAIDVRGVTYLKHVKRDRRGEVVRQRLEVVVRHRSAVPASARPRLDMRVGTAEAIFQVRLVPGREPLVRAYDTYTDKSKEIHVHWSRFSMSKRGDGRLRAVLPMGVFRYPWSHGGHDHRAGAGKFVLVSSAEPTLSIAGRGGSRASDHVDRTSLLGLA